MGRTAKYKKIKKTSVSSDGIWGLGYDGVKPNKRSRTAEKLRQAKLNRRLKRNKHAQEPDRGIDRAPDIQDEFDLQDPQGSVRRQEQEKEQAIVELPLVKKSPSAAATTMDRKEIQEATQLLNATASGDKPPKYEGRREHESKNAYQRRVKEETRHIITQTKLKELNPEKRQRKKEFLKQKKKKGKRSMRAEEEDEDYDRIPVDDVPFGHQVERPPDFKSLPRGAAAKPSSKQKKKQTTMKTDQEVQAEQENLEKMRQKVQEQYALIKAKRKRAGDFHL